MKYHPLYKLDRGALTGLEIGTVKATGPERPTVWLCGGHPSILADAETINTSPWPRMTLNNTAEIIRANWALFLDEPGGYLQNLLTDGQHVVIARLNYESAIVGGKKWCEQPRTMFLSDIGKEEGDWLSEGPLVWFKNSFCLAIQLLYRMGFRRIMLAGCKFGDAGKYAYGERPDLADKNAKLYADQVEWLRRNLDYFTKRGLEIGNTTPGNATPFLPQSTARGVALTCQHS